VCLCMICREISETQASMKTVEDTKSQLLLTTNELQLKLEARISLYHAARLSFASFAEENSSVSDWQNNVML